MIEMAIASFVIFLLITALVKQPWNWLLLFTDFRPVLCTVLAQFFS